jgi:hypothetical protein
MMKFSKRAQGFIEESRVFFLFCELAERNTATVLVFGGAADGGR